MAMTPNLQTLAFIQTIDNLFKEVRSPDTEEETALFLDYTRTRDLLNHTFKISHIILLWNKDEISKENRTRRKKLIKTLELTFHMYFRKMNDSFTKVRNSYLPLAPGIETLYVFSIPSADELAVLYAHKSKMLETYLFRNTRSKRSEMEKETNEEEKIDDV